MLGLFSAKSKIDKLEKRIYDLENYVDDLVATNKLENRKALMEEITKNCEAQFMIRLNQIVQEYFLRPPGRAETSANWLEDLIGMTNSL